MKLYMRKLQSIKKTNNGQDPFYFNISVFVAKFKKTFFKPLMH